MEIQVAIDLVDLQRAVDLAQLLVGEVDRLEVGTPLLLRHGTDAIAAIRPVSADSTIVVDCKTMDCGALHAQLALESGADGLIVQAAAPRATLVAACRVAESLGGFVMVDGLGVADMGFIRGRIDG